MSELQRLLPERPAVAAALVGDRGGYPVHFIIPEDCMLEAALGLGKIYSHMAEVASLLRQNASNARVAVELADMMVALDKVDAVIRASVNESPGPNNIQTKARTVVH